MKTKYLHINASHLVCARFQSILQEYINSMGGFYVRFKVPINRKTLRYIIKKNNNLDYFTITAGLVHYIRQFKGCDVVSVTVPEKFCGSITETEALKEIKNLIFKHLRTEIKND